MRIDRRSWSQGVFLARCRKAFRELNGEDEEVRRDAEIRSLDSKFWNGRKVFRVMCRGEFGKGNHEMWVEEWILWNLMSLDAFKCSFHR